MHNLIKNKRLADMLVGMVAGLCLALLWPAVYTLAVIGGVGFAAYMLTVARNRTTDKNDAVDADFTVNEGKEQ